MNRTVFLALASLVALNACVALPDYSRDVTTTRFQALSLADLPDDRAVFLVNRCTDRPDRKEVCSDSGDHGQFLTLQKRGWKMDGMFQPTASDFTLSTYHGTKYGTFIPAPKMGEGSEEFAVGDFVTLQWGVFKPETVRVWLRLSPLAVFRASPVLNGERAGSGEQRAIWPIAPTLVCRKMVTEFQIETMIVPLVYTYKEHKLGRSVQESCDVSQ